MPDGRDVYLKMRREVKHQPADRWRALTEGDSLLLCCTPTILASTATAAANIASSTFRIAIFVAAAIDVEKAIIRASRSGNGVPAEVGERQALFLELSPRRGRRGQ